jgi:hypothetical protein
VLEIGTDARDLAPSTKAIGAIGVLDPDGMHLGALIEARTDCVLGGHTVYSE